MEVKGQSLFARLFLAEKVPFSDKRDVNWRAVKWTAIGLVLAFVMVVLVMPSKPEPQGDEEVAAAAPQRPRELETPQDFGSNSRDISAYYQRPSYGGGQGPPSRQATMIVGRGGLDYRTQLPPGSRIPVKLLQGAIISSESMPIVGVVTADVEQESGVAIEKGSKLYGEASFNDSGDVATVTWTSIQMADGRERQIAAIGVSLSGHVGVQGNIHSKRAQNVAGGMISRFIGAYAEGSMSRGLLGFSQGGTENGLKQAVAETAKDQADSYASDLKKEKRWIEIEAGTDCLAVLKQPFAFRDPGAYAR